LLIIRLRRIGKTGQPSFQIVTAEHKEAVKGKFIELLGHYNPSLNPSELKLNTEREKYWLEHGAQPSFTVASLLRQEKILPPLSKEELLKIQKKRPKRKEKKAEEEAKEKSAPVAESTAPAAPEAKKEETPRTEAPRPETPKAPAKPTETPKPAEKPKEESKPESKPENKPAQQAPKQETPAPKEEPKKKAPKQFPAPQNKASRH